jgi:hypothetical protein
MDEESVGGGGVAACGVFQVGMLSEYSPQGTEENNKKNLCEDKILGVLGRVSKRVPL